MFHYDSQIALRVLSNIEKAGEFKKVVAMRHKDGSEERFYRVTEALELIANLFKTPRHHAFFIGLVDWSIKDYQQFRDMRYSISFAPVSSGEWGRILAEVPKDDERLQGEPRGRFGLMFTGEHIQYINCRTVQDESNTEDMYMVIRGSHSMYYLQSNMITTGKTADEKTTTGLSVIESGKKNNAGRKVEILSTDYISFDYLRAMIHKIFEAEEVSMSYEIPVPMIIDEDEEQFEHEED